LRAVDIIVKKRDRGELTKEEIEFFIRGYTDGEIPDYQASALIMAILLNGMTDREITDLTLAMAYSGEVLDLSDVVSIAVDKHSTGGVGDKTTLVVEPLVAACGLPVGKMSGHGLGFSGGTLDKMESIPGFRTDLSTEEFIHQLKTVGLVLTGQTMDLAPADGKLYALRDVTGTVQSIPLIASSVMSKKIASGATAIVLDVKVGVGAFMPNLDQARILSNLMVSIAKKVGRKAIALISDMNQPLGFAVGNALELKEAIKSFHGDGPPDFIEHCLTVAGYLLTLGGVSSDELVGYRMAQKALKDGRGWDRFLALVSAQHGDLSYVENPDLLPQGTIARTISSPQSGYLKEINAKIIGEGAVMLGAGRTKKGDVIDHGVGIVLFHKVGDIVDKGDDLFTIYANNENNVNPVRDFILQGIKWSETPVERLPLFYEVVR
jgi:pyrimidine-nucleoside phosphorylase